MQIQVTKVPSKRRFAVKVALTLACMALFGAQSYRELKKYFSKLTSTAVSTQTDKNIGYPTIVICSHQGYKKNIFALTTEMFVKNTYSYHDIFVNGSFSPDNMTNVKVIHTFFNGRCYVITGNANLTYKDWMKFQVHDLKKVTISIVQKDEELCVIMGICTDTIDKIKPTDEVIDLNIKVHMQKWPETLCNQEPNYSQFKCLSDYIQQTVEHNHTCYLMHQMLEFDNRKAKPCGNASEFTAAEQETMALYQTTTNQPESIGCKLQCSTIRYESKLFGYPSSLILNTFVHGKSEFGMINFKVISSKISVSEEYQVYDLSSILGSLGGSLGLFVGFSILQCMLSTLNKLTF